MLYCLNKSDLRVPARVGGVDLSTNTARFRFSRPVPARVGGVDLSSICCWTG